MFFACRVTCRVNLSPLARVWPIGFELPAGRQHFSHHQPCRRANFGRTYFPALQIASPATLFPSHRIATVPKVAVLHGLRLAASEALQLLRANCYVLYAGRVARKYRHYAVSPSSLTAMTRSVRHSSALATLAEPRPDQPHFSVPLPRKAIRQPSTMGQRIHVVGEDERARFLAHAFCRIYNSVEMMTCNDKSKTRYRNIQKARDRGKTTPEYIPNQALPQSHVSKSSSHISELVVTGPGHAVTQTLEKLKHRVDEKTTIYLMNNGLGVLEDVKKNIFDDSKTKPDFVLGHMSHRFAFNNVLDSVKVMRRGVTKLTSIKGDHAHGSYRNVVQTQHRPDLIRVWKQTTDLRASWTDYDEWLHFKLPSVLFDSVVEPVCALLDLRYQSLVGNTHAMRIMDSLLTETLNVVGQLPETGHSATIQNWVSGKHIQRFLFTRILGKKYEPSRLVRLLRNGKPSDVEYLNGYFIRRGLDLGLDVRLNSFMRDLVQAKLAERRERNNSFMPFDPLTLPKIDEEKHSTPAVQILKPRVSGRHAPTAVMDTGTVETAAPDNRGAEVGHEHSAGDATSHLLGRCVLDSS